MWGLTVLDREELTSKLCAFNLSPNQSKVYAYLCEVGSASISDISDVTKIYPQDIYKIIVAIEKKGLVLRKNTSPLIIEAMPVEQGLKQLFISIKNDSSEKMSNLKGYYTEIEENVKIRNCKERNNCSIIVLSQQAPQSRIDLAVDNLRNQYDCILPDGQFKWLDYCKFQFKRIAKRNAVIRIMIVNEGNRFLLANSMVKIMPEKGNYEIRILQVDKKIATLTLIDSREVWLPLPSIGKEQAILITDAKEIVEIAKLQFETLWNDRNTKVRASSIGKTETITKSPT